MNVTHLKLIFHITGPGCLRNIVSNLLHLRALAGPSIILYVEVAKNRRQKFKITWDIKRITEYLLVFIVEDLLLNDARQ